MGFERKDQFYGNAELGKLDAENLHFCGLFCLLFGDACCSYEFSEIVDFSAVPKEYTCQLNGPECQCDQALGCTTPNTSKYTTCVKSKKKYQKTIYYDFHKVSF